MTMEAATTAVAGASILMLDGLPCLRDQALGHLLGLRRADDIRRLIARYRTELEAFGPVRRIPVLAPLGSGAFRTVQEYYLTRQQSLFIASRARGPVAVEALIEMIKTCCSNGGEPGRGG